MTQKTSEIIDPLADEHMARAYENARDLMSPPDTVDPRGWFKAGWITAREIALENSEVLRLKRDLDKVTKERNDARGSLRIMRERAERDTYN